MPKLFTIITVVKNNIHNISSTIESVLGQKFKNYEYIILDGKSSDGTEKLIRQKYLTNSKIKFISYNDTGIYSAINYAVKKSSGSYIGLIHSGDLYANNEVLGKIAAKIKNLDFLYGGVKFYNKFLKLIRIWNVNKKYDVNNFYNIPHPALFVKKRICLKYPYNEKYRISSDTEFIMNLVKNFSNYEYINETIQYMNNQGISNNLKYLLKKIIEDLKILKKKTNFFLIEYLKKIISKISTIFILNNIDKNLLKIFELQKIKSLDDKNYFQNSFLNNKITVSTTANTIPYKKNFILSGLNMAFLGSFVQQKLFLHQNLFHWIDGYLGSLLINQKYEKLAGRNLLRNLKIPLFIKRIIFVGNISKKGLKIMEKILLKKIVHVKVPYASPYEIYKHLPIIKKNDLVFLLFSTPKQEQVAQYLLQFNIYCKVICIGGAVNILTKQESEVPRLLDRINLEWLWRLHKDSLRRFIRLLETAFFYNIYKFHLKSIKFEFVK
jgi:glycosyltransferase involved in cell wall biosynthesis